MLSYDKMIFLDSWVILANAESIHTRTLVLVLLIWIVTMTLEHDIKRV